MKKIFMALCAVVAMASCSNNDDFEAPSTLPTPSSSSQKTTVSIGGQEISTLASDGMYVTKLSSGTPTLTNLGVAQAGTAGKQKIHFYVRVDNNDEAGAGAQNSTYYFPQDSKGGSIFSDANAGYVNASADVAWGKYDSRTTRYVYDSKGEVTASTLISAPSLSQLIKANQGQSISEKLAAIDTTQYKVIWYVVKYEDNLWHCDGVLVKNDVDQIPDSIKPDGMDDQGNKGQTPENPDTIVKTSSDSILVDIHQQEHNNWTQVKTSVHLRDTVSQVIVEIPIPYENVAEQDDFLVRTYTLETPTQIYINGYEYNLKEDKALSIKVEHQATKVVITIDVLDKSYIEAMKDASNGDGPTVEIATYSKNLTNEELWQLVKQSKVSAYAYKTTKYDEKKIHTDISNAFGF